MKNRKSIGIVAAIAALATVLTGCSSTPEDNSVTDVALYYSSPIAEFSLAQIALDNNLFPSNVKVDVKGGDSTVGVTLASSGRVQFYVNSSPVPEQVVSGGAPLQWVATWQDGITTAFIARPGINSVKDLVGKKVGIIAPGLTLAVLANAAMRDASVDPSKVTPISLGTLPAVNSAFAAGTVDAVVTNAASAKALLAQVPGAKTLVDFTDKFQWIGAGVTVNTDWAKDHPKAVTSVLKGLNAALELLHKEPAKAKPSIATVTKLTGDALDFAVSNTVAHTTPTLTAPSLDAEKNVMKVLWAEGNGWANEAFAQKMIGNPVYLQDALKK